MVERGFEVSTPKIEGKMSMRFCDRRNRIVGCVRSRKNLLPEGKGLGGPFGCLNRRYGIAWGAMGAAEFVGTLRVRALERNQFGRPLAANQLIQKKLADMQTEIVLGGKVVSGWNLFDEGKLAVENISLMKRNNCGKALKSPDRLATCTGAMVSLMSIMLFAML